MQQFFALKPAQSVVFNKSAYLGILAMTIVGCGQKTVVPTGPATQPLSGVTITLSLSDPALQQVLGLLSRSWATKSGARVSVANDSSGDIRLFRPVAFGEAAAKGQILPLPKALRDAANPYQINGIVDAFSEGIAGWNGRPFGVVLATETSVLVYRKDRFDDPAIRSEFKTRFSRDLAPPATWEEAASIAGFFTEKDKKPSLAALPNDPAKLLDLFHCVAACTDRPAITPSNSHGRKLNDVSFASEVVSFHFLYSTGKPRLTSHGFALAAELLAAMQPSRATGGSDDPVAALDAGAVFSVVTMRELSRLPKGTDGAVQPKYGVAKLPGTKRYYDNAFKAVVEANGTEANFVTYLSGGWIGAVSTSCKNPDAAFELLGELGGPTGTTAVVSEPACGSGPWRGELLDAGRKSLWYPYGFSADQTDALIRAMRPYVATDLRNPVIGPRGPGKINFSPRSNRTSGQRSRGK